MAKYTCVKKLKVNYCTAYPIADADTFGLVKLGSGFTVGEDGSISVSGGSQSVDWGSITDKPETFAPSAHTHPFTEITGVATAAQIPNLAASKITSGTFAIGRIPTGTTSSTVALGDHTHTTANITGLDTTLSELDGRITAAQRAAINALISPTQDYVDMTEATAAIKSIIDALQAI